MKDWDRVRLQKIANLKGDEKYAPCQLDWSNQWHCGNCPINPHVDGKDGCCEFDKIRPIAARLLAEAENGGTE